MNKNLYLHVHIWKTAGTTFFDICRRNFGSGFRRDTMLYQQWFLTAHQIEEMVDFNDAWLNCYSSHMLSGDLPFHSCPHMKAITFVRDPIARIISNYKFQCSKRYRGGAAKGKTLSEYLDSLIYSRDFPYYRNGYAYQLCDERTEEAVAKFCQLVADGKVMLFTAERFDDACIILERLFPEDFKDCSYVRQNVSDKKKIDASEHLEKLSGYLSLDYKICKLAGEFMDTKLKEVFDCESSLEEYQKGFMKRCERRRKRAKLTGGLKTIYRRLRSLT